MSRRDDIEELARTMRDGLVILGRFDPSVFGVREIHDNTKHSLRYVNKLRDEYLCSACGDDILEGEEWEHWFKARRHTKCIKG